MAGGDDRLDRPIDRRVAVSDEQRRVAVVGDAGFYVGPELARHLAARGHDLVLGDPSPELVDELTAAGAAVEVVERRAQPGPARLGPRRWWPRRWTASGASTRRRPSAAGS